MLHGFQNFFIGLVCALLICPNVGHTASGSATYIFSFKDNQNLKVNKATNGLLEFSVCEGSSCERLGRKAGYTLKELNNAKLRHNIKRGAVNTVAGAAVTCASLLGAGVGMAVPFVVSYAIPIDSVSLVGMLLSWAALPVTSMAGGLTALGYSGAMAASVRDEFSPTSMEGAAEVLASIPSESVSYWRRIVRWFSPALNHSVASATGETTVVFDVHEEVRSQEIISSLSYLLNSVPN